MSITFRCQVCGEQPITSFEVRSYETFVLTAPITLHDGVPVTSWDRTSPEFVNTVDQHISCLTCGWRVELDPDVDMIDTTSPGTNQPVPIPTGEWE